MDRIASAVADLGFDGAPDLVLYRAEPPLVWFVEVKSANDRLRDSQKLMLKALSAIAGVRCQVCCPSSALKRMASALAEKDSSEEESGDDDDGREDDEPAEPPEGKILYGSS